MRNFWFASLLLLLMMSGCRVHTLDDGAYDFTLGEILRDDCGLAATAGAVPPGGTLRTEGNLTNFALTQPELRLIGTYRYSVEELTMDGSLSNYSTVLRGQECLVDTVAFHLDATTVDASSFTGAMSINYEARQPDACTCRFWFKFSAKRK